MKGTFILLALFFQNILTCYSQNQDSVFVFIGGTNKVLTRNNNMGLYFFKNIPNFETEFAEKHAIMFISDNVYLINDSGKTDIFSIYDSLIISNGRLLKESSCDYSDEDSIFCYILTNAICGEIDTNFMQNFLDTLNSFGISQVNINENRYNIVIPKDRNIITIINCINQLFFVQDVRFDQFFNIKLGTTDPLFSYQYYLSNPSNNFDINILPAWELTKGSSLINIGIWDDGVSDEHPDLDVNKIIQYPGSNFSTKFFSYQYNNDVSPYWIYDLNLYPWDNPNKPIPNKYLRATHGTAMAGIISADHNSIGIKGIAPFCKIAPIKMSFGNCVNQYPGIYDSQLNEIVQYIDDNTGNRFFDVVNCSWYFGFPYNGNSPLTKPKSYKAFENLIKNGRFGRGTTMVACTGNDS